MTPVDSYNSQVNFPEIVKGVQNNKTLEVTDQCLLLFGNGDGGGGPTAWMLEKVSGLHQPCYPCSCPARTTRIGHCYQYRATLGQSRRRLGLLGYDPLQYR
jgi:alpha-mannosidase